MSQSPYIINDSTHDQLSLLWSPPFLWPGERIDYFNVSFMNKSDGSIEYYKVDSVFSDQVVNLTVVINPNETCTTAEIKFCISPVSVSGQLLRERNVTGWITPLCTFNLIQGCILGLDSYTLYLLYSH